MNEFWLYSLYIVATVHGLYGLLFLFGLIKKHGFLPYQEPVSVIIAARNEADNLQKYLPAVLQQQEADFEVIVVLNETTDASASNLEKLSRKYPRLRIINLEQIPKGIHAKKHALAMGIEAAKHDALLFTDADCQPSSPYWIREMAKGFKTNQVVLGLAPYRSGGGLTGWLTEFETTLTAIQYISLATLGYPYMGVGRNLAYRKSLFESRQGFDGFQAVTGGDDDLFVQKCSTGKNTCVQISTDAQMISEPQPTMTAYFHQKLRHLSVGRYYRASRRIFLGVFTLTHSTLWAFLLLGFFTDQPAALLTLVALGYLPLLIANVLFQLKTKGSLHILKFIILDVVFTIFYIFVGIRVMFTKRIEWTN